MTTNGDVAADEAKRRLLEMLQGGSSAAEPAPSAERDVFEGSLVRLQPEGTKRPFFCVHPGSGTVGCFFEVAQMLGTERPFYAFQPPGVDGECEPIADLKALASGYVRQMRKVQPHGPYALGGWSAGGMIAFQMAHELRAAGEEVALLVLCDTVNNELYPALPFPRPVIASFVHRQLALMVDHLARQRGKELPPGEALARFEAVKPRSLVTRIDLIFKLLHEAGVFQSLDSPLFKVFRSNLVALTGFDVPQEPLDATITLLRCKNEEFGVDLAQANPTYHWAPRTNRPVDVIEMPSHHFALFHGDVAPITAATLTRLLEATDPS